MEQSLNYKLYKLVMGAGSCGMAPKEEPVLLATNWLLIYYHL